MDENHKPDPDGPAPALRHNRALSQLRLAIAYVAIGSLLPPRRELRKHSKGKIQKLKKSLSTFGIVYPILVDNDRRIVAGHALWLAAKDAGFVEVPTITVDHLSANEVRVLSLALNKLSEDSPWDESALQIELKELLSIDLDFGLDVSAFEFAEIDAIVGASDLDSNIAADTLPTPCSVAVTHPGDIWQLGEHRIICGSSLEASVYETLMMTERAQAVIADAPYNVRIQGHAGSSGDIQHREFAMASGEMTSDEFTAFLGGVIDNLVAYSVDGSLHYLFMDFVHQWELQTAARTHGLTLKNIAVWAKDTPGMGSFLRSQHELVLIFKSGTKRHRNNVQLGRFGRNRSNLWAYPSVGAFARKTEEGSLLELHPTVKPVRLVADAILDCTNPKEIVLDPFLGSGTTLIASQRTRRRCFGIEIDPLYVDTAVRRWQAYSGGKAARLSTGKLFDEIEDTKEIRNE